MNARTARIASLLAFVARTAAAQPAIASGLEPGAGEVEVSAHFGVATTPFDVVALPEAKGQAFVFLLGARYALSEPLSLELSFPFALGSVAQPAGSYIDAAALGNPELGARYRFLERGSGDSALALDGALKIGAPLASHDEDLLQNRLLAVADGIEGRGEPESFTPGVVPITLSSTLAWESRRFRVTGELGLPLLVRVSDADLPSATADPRALGLAAVLGVEARYRLSRPLSLAGAAQLFFDLVPAVAHVRDVSPVQDLERLGLLVHFSQDAALAVELKTAIGGALGGSMVAGGLRATVNFR